MKINIKNIRVKSICATLFISLFLSCNNGIVEELQKQKDSIFSISNLRQGFLDIVTSFGDIIAGTLGFNAVTSEDKRSAVGVHFDKVKKGLEDIKGKLDGLAKEIASAPHADTIGVGAVKEAIKKAIDEVISKLIDSVIKLAGVTKADGNIGDNDHSSGALPANEASVKAIIAEVKSIIEVAEQSGVKIEPGSDGAAVKSGDATAPAALAASTVANAKAGSLLADEVAKADPWAMINKIKNSTTNTSVLSGNDKDAGTLATGTKAADNNGAGAKTNADLAAAVALKAMTAGGRFSAAQNEAGAVKGAAVSAVNKVLGVLDEIIRKIVVKKLDKIGEALRGIEYSETVGATSEGKN
ncbi:variable large family protein (plasmid) [Borrelia coriaceae]|uniref:Variable large protein n=1 Tax=Borrelia coriaceae ATCC 43381 TaxID=1408429 RepID=W5SX43_9SPIR|nr:variable large family protein [Borrelia coriaceae]AHH11432.1 Variable major protein [Borrelia coriaceae ATCC 43381]UPA17412.1 variable large family protein [Borrelia coriaceae]